MPSHRACVYSVARRSNRARPEKQTTSFARASSAASRCSIWTCRCDAFSVRSTSTRSDIVSCSGANRKLVAVGSSSLCQQSLRSRPSSSSSSVVELELVTPVYADTGKSRPYHRRLGDAVRRRLQDLQALHRAGRLEGDRGHRRWDEHEGAALLLSAADDERVRSSTSC
jgi:hypothetical protein